MKKLVFILSVAIYLSVATIHSTTFARISNESTKSDFQTIVSENNYSLNELLTLIQVERLKRVEQVRINNENTKDIVIRLIEVNDNGYYFFDKSAKYEQIIYVDHETVEYFGVDDLKIGQKVTGIFDETGWELFGLERIEKKNTCVKL